MKEKVLGGTFYGIPRVEILANKQLPKKSLPYGYYEVEVAHMSGLWQYVTRTAHFTFVVENFGVKHVDKQTVNILIVAIKAKDTILK